MATDRPFHAWSSDIMNTMLGRSADMTGRPINVVATKTSNRYMFYSSMTFRFVS